MHIINEYSALDGMGKVKEMFMRAKEMGQDALAVTDHGTCAGHFEAQEVADELGMKAILGCEFYYERENDEKNGHLLVLAKDDVGLRNIYKMHEIAFMDNFYYRARINWDILKEHSEGIIVTSACLGSTFNQHLLKGEYELAKSWARKFHEVFGDDFYLELQPNDMPEQFIANTGSIRIAEELGIELVATNDVHYVYEEDSYTHEVLLAMQTGSKMDDEDRFKLPDDAFWLKSEDEMYATFNTLDPDKVKQAIMNTRVIADKCNARIKKGRYLPKYYATPGSKTPRELLIELTMQGAREKGYATDAEYMADVQHEINVIDEEGYADYFLIVQDYINTARENGVLVGDGRGSGSGSKVAYLTDIHQIDPEEYDLLFERFMAHGRTPDIDTDFSDQEAVYRDLQKKYGAESVARIATYGRMTPRAVIRRVLSAFGVAFGEVSKITRLIPDLCPSLEVAYEQVPELLKKKKQYSDEWKVIERLEGVISHVGTHAGGVVVYPNLSDHIPLMNTGQDRSMRVSTYDMNAVENLGFYKFDILGLETVKDIKRCLDSIQHTEDVTVDLASIDYNDPASYNTLCAGDVSGVFQLSAQSTKVMEQQPRSFVDLIAINALIRPGVGDWEEYLERRRGKKWSTYEARRAYMEETEGIITYQEQYLLDANVLAGWPVAYADKHLRKNPDIRNDTELREKFLADTLARGHSAEDMEAVWSEIEEAVDGGYGFNKSHSASYSRLSLQTAWLKTHYPEHFYASLMSGEKTDADGQNNIASYIAEAKERGISILPPDINNSGDTFVVAEGGINYRITAISHVGDSAIKHINKLRPIKSFDDFLERRERRYAQRNVVINLIKAGAFDFDEPNRAELLWRFAQSERTKTQIKENFESPRHEWNDSVKCEWEKEVLGMYLSLHPMEKYGFRSLDEFEEGSRALQGGEVASIYEFHPRKDPNNPKMAFVTIDTLFGHVKLVVFANIWAQESTKEALTKGNLVLVNGTRSGNDLLAYEVEVL